MILGSWEPGPGKIRAGPWDKIDASQPSGQGIEPRPCKFQGALLWAPAAGDSPESERLAGEGTGMGIEPGTRVRLKNDPSRIGVALANIRKQGAVAKQQVQFPDGVSYVPVDQLEVVQAGAEDPVDLLERGRLGDVLDLRRTLTHVRLTGRLANVIYSMDTTGTDFYAYQFKPVVKLLNSMSNGLLITDEVGLGKTIEAGLVWTELRQRFEFRRLLVVCPAVLRNKWRRELRSRFGVDAELQDAAGTLERLRQAAEEGHAAKFAIVASMQGLRPRRGWDDEQETAEGPASSQLARFLQGRDQQEPLVDLCVIDEAHYLRNPGTMTSALGTLLRRACHYLVLLSATPVHLHSRDLFQLLQLLDEDVFAREQDFDDILEANEPLVRARDLVASGHADVEELMRILREAHSNPLLRGNQQLATLLATSFAPETLREPADISRIAQRLERVNLLGHVLTRTRRREVTEWRVLREPTAEAVPMNAAEAEFYEKVTTIVRAYCKKRGAHEGFLLVTPQRQMCSSMPAALRFWKSHGECNEDEVWDDLGIDDPEYDRLRDDEEHPLRAELVRCASELGDLDVLWQSDSKYARLRERLISFFEAFPKEKVVLFSYFRATLDYLHERLLQDGIVSLVLKGGEADKDSVIEGFRTHAGRIVLLSSEVGSEGIDLQFAWVIINYDLPWNPMRVEQRIGRLDRLGQQADKVHIWNLFYDQTIDARIYRRLLERLEIFKKALGGLEPVLGDKIRILTDELLREGLTPEEEEQRIEQTRIAIENNLRNEEDLEGEAAHLVAYGDYILNQVQAARELGRTIDADDLRMYVLDFFRMHYQGSSFVQSSQNSDLYSATLSAEAKYDLAEFIRSERLQGETSLARADMRDVACRFQNTAVADVRERTEILSQFHPLVRFVSARILELEEQTRPAIAIRASSADLPAALPPGEYAFSVQMWSVQGIQDLEQLHFAAALLDDPTRSIAEELAEQLVTSGARVGRDWIGAAKALDLDVVARAVKDTCLAEAERRYDDHVAQLRAENEDRATLQERTLERHLANQMRTLENVRHGHERRGRAPLVAATEGRIHALQARVEQKRLQIQKQRQMRCSNKEVCVGVIKVTVAEAVPIG
jgi:superfamily II DNA or RNA helicase